MDGDPQLHPDLKKALPRLLEAPALYASKIEKSICAKMTYDQNKLLERVDNIKKQMGGLEAYCDAVVRLYSVQNEQTVKTQNRLLLLFSLFALAQAITILGILGLQK